METRGGAGEVTRSKDTDASRGRQPRTSPPRPRGRRRGWPWRARFALHHEQRQRQGPQRERARAGRSRTHVPERDRPYRPCHVLSHDGPKKRPRALPRERRSLGRSVATAPALPRTGARPRCGAAASGGARARRVPRRPGLRHLHTRAVASPWPLAGLASAAASVGARLRAGCGPDALRGHGRAPRPCRGSSSPSPLPE